MRELGEQPAPEEGQVTHAALFRGGRPRAAWRRTKKQAYYVHDDSEGIAVPQSDAQYAAEVRRCRRQPWRVPFGEAVNTMVRGGATYEIGDDVVWPEVLEVTLPTGRTTYAHNLPSRYVQRLYVDVVQPVAEVILPETLFSYRPGRTHFDALYVARGLARQGWNWALRLDLAKFFDTVRLDQIEAALADPRLRLHESMQRLGLSFQASNILRPGGGWSKMPGTLLQGSVVAPLLSNLTALRELDEPFQQHFGRRRGVVALRYGDDILIMSRRRPDAVHARDALDELTKAAGWSFKSGDKSMDDAVHLAQVSVRYLGKLLSQDTIETPEPKVLEHVQRVATAEPSMRHTAIHNLVVDLMLDEPQALETARCHLEGYDGRLTSMFDSARNNLAQSRTLRLGSAERILATVHNNLEKGGTRAA